MKGIVDCCIRKLNEIHNSNEILSVADIGCNTGELGLMWAKKAYNVYGLDVNQALLDVAKERAKEAGVEIKYCLGSATKLPWPDETMDVCVAPELLEHVADWESCLQEFTRVLRPKGLLYISTSSKLCPKQEEFDLPLYSWYPSILKRYYENLARTTRPEIAGYAKYPAVNWFSFYQLRKELAKMGMESYDRFDIMDISNKSSLQKLIIKMIKMNPILRWCAHVATSGTTMLSVKNS